MGNCDLSNVNPAIASIPKDENASTLIGENGDFCLFLTIA